MLEGLVAIITGGANGIGGATVRQLAEAGAKVVIADYDEEGALAARRPCPLGGRQSDGDPYGYFGDGRDRSDETPR